MTFSREKWLTYCCVMQSKMRLFYRQHHTILFYIKHYLDQFLGQRPNVTVVSYPKSGRTWIEQSLIQVACLKYGISSATIEHYKQLFKMESEVPSVRFSHASSSWEELIIYDQDELLRIPLERFAKGKVVFLYRHPGDVLVSSFYHLKYRNEMKALTREDMITSRIFGLHKVLRFMNMWHDFCHGHPGQCLSLSYEAFKQDTLSELRRLCGFIGLETDDHVLLQAVNACEFEKMKKLESQNVYTSPRLSSPNTDNPHSFKVRRGRLGVWQAFFSQDQVRHIERMIAEELNNNLSYKSTLSDLAP